MSATRKVRPPTAYGFDNFNGISSTQQILLNTICRLSVAATVMALVFGFRGWAWILTRDQLSPGPPSIRTADGGAYYLTPLLGALGMETASVGQKAAPSIQLWGAPAELAISHSISIRS